MYSFYQSPALKELKALLKWNLESKNFLLKYFCILNIKTCQDTMSKLPDLFLSAIFKIQEIHLNKSEWYHRRKLYKLLQKCLSFLLHFTTLKILIFHSFPKIWVTMIEVIQKLSSDWLQSLHWIPKKTKTKKLYLVSPISWILLIFEW